MEIRTTAIVVAYNRKSLLQNFVHAHPGQTRKPDHILIADNVTTDDSSEMLARLGRLQYGEVELPGLVHTRGGAGGLSDLGLHYQHGRWPFRH
jgi:rhamnopyranosyl-N-acetylglucosaminyl-diphospho-decaprenol beta-1,3/1,4-galactofuranosyltransferase